MSNPVRRYRAYGLSVDSDIDLPWPAAAPGGDPDITIRLGCAPRTLESPADGHGYWQTAPDAFLLSVDGAGRCLVSDGGRRVRVALADRAGGAIPPFMLDSVLAAVLQMRGALTLHASAVATAAGAVLFAGPAGCGKSTLAAGLVDRGYSLLADEIAAVVPGGGGPPLALGGFPQVRLWADAIDGLDEYWRRSAGAPIRPGVENYAIPARRFRGGKLALQAVYVLSSDIGEDVVFEPLPPVRAFAALKELTYRFRQLRGLGRMGDHFRTATAAARRVAVQRLVTPYAMRPAALANQVAEILPPPSEFCD